MVCMGTRQRVACVECGKALSKYPINPTTGEPIKHFFCGHSCKASWQRRARPVTREWLNQKYSIEKLDCNAIGRIVKRDPKRVWEWLKDWGIPTRPRGSYSGVTVGFKKGEPSRFKGHKQKRGAESPHWQGGITPQRQAFYASDEWRAVSKQVYARDKKCCQRCGISQRDAAKIGVKLNIHHIVGFRVKHLRAELSNLVLLCRPCHLFVHSKKNINLEFRKNRMGVLNEASGDNWQLWNGDCVEVLSGLPDASVDYQIGSPPFCSLYTFSDDPRDMSNCRTDSDFWTHYKFLIAECYRVLKPGRLVSIHCMNLPTSKLRDGFIGLRDFRGDIIKAHQEAGFYFHSEVVIRKDPVSAMQRTKAIGLLHKQIKKDSAISRMAVPDYIVTMRKPGDNPEPIAGEFDAYYGDETPPDGPLQSRTWDETVQKMVPCTVRPGDPGYSVAVWQRYAEPVWMDIAQGDVLSRKEAREVQDEAHIAPLQLTPIRRCLELWSNPGDVVLSPFAGIGSELYVALQMGRRAIGAELKPSYYRQAVQNCQRAAAEAAEKGMAPECAANKPKLVPDAPALRDVPSIVPAATPTAKRTLPECLLELQAKIPNIRVLFC